jgi:hypothetical protein
MSMNPHLLHVKRVAMLLKGVQRENGENVKAQIHPPLERAKTGRSNSL